MPAPAPVRPKRSTGRPLQFTLGTMVDALPRMATTADAETVAELLHAFNTEFDTPTPEAAVLAARLRVHLSGGGLAGLLLGEPADGFGLLSFRPNVWYDGPVALLDELYVRPALRGRRRGTALLEAAEQLARSRGCELLEINVDGDDTDARRFYERHGYRNTEPGATDALLYYYRELR